MENPIKMDDLGVPLFSETPIYFHAFAQVYRFCQLTCITKHGNLFLQQTANESVCSSFEW